VRYALNLGAAGASGDAATLGDLAAVAEDAGWDGVFLEDYIVYQSREDIPTYDPWVVLAAMALRTRRIRLGTLVTPPSRRRPWKLARETVTLDHLSGGRLTLGVAMGDTLEPGFGRLGETTDARQRASMLDEALTVLVGLWSGQPFSHQGQHYRVDEVTFLPRPLQTPRIPIWVGGSYPHRAPLLRAARFDGAALYRYTEDGSWRNMTPDEVRDARRVISGARTTADPFDLAIGGTQRGTDWGRDREMIASLGEAGATWWEEWIPPGEPSRVRAAIARGPLRID
jgi:alkanesulfonate monooxygenase SsuD/methylene tetrahydromethanopterin reductase-like flavin-dependent oxidoreductase (luciferase family)